MPQINGVTFSKPLHHSDPKVLSGAVSGDSSRKEACPSVLLFTLFPVWNTSFMETSGLLSLFLILPSSWVRVCVYVYVYVCIATLIHEYSQLFVSTRSASAYSATMFTIGNWLNLPMWNLPIQRADYTRPFYIRDLSICGFDTRWGPGNSPLQTPRDNCVYIYIYIYIYMCVCVCVCIYVYIYVCVYIYMYIYVCMYIYIWNLHLTSRTDLVHKQFLLFL